MSLMRFQPGSHVVSSQVSAIVAPWQMVCLREVLVPAVAVGGLFAAD